ncbi:MAG: hypothetical protein GXO35_08595 [Gammaproteobacteria bacterium]|nr:hypothetical protein [Gammaproteobacteria bacterium]
MSNQPMFKTHTFEISFTKEVNYESIQELCRQIDLAVDYYKYTQITLNINSPGGELAALKHYLFMLNKWREKGVNIVTIGEVSVASAAALMLCLGDFGSRYCYPHTNILFHYARLAGVSNLTSEKSTELSKELSKADDELLTLVSQHISKHISGHFYPLDTLKIEGKKFTKKERMSAQSLQKLIKTELDRLFVLDNRIEPTAAKSFLLIDHIL